MIGLGLSISTLGPPWPLWIGHGLFIGLIGLGGINAPLYIYVSRWFDRRRGSALALISSGTYLAGAMWPPIFEQAIVNFGWRQAMLWYALAEIVVVVPLAAIYFRAPPEVIHPVALSGSGSSKARVLGWPPNAVFAMMCGAGVLCCIPMAMPQGHLVAFCSDLGISRSAGALMLSVLLGTAFLSRQIWGAISDRIGGLATVLIGSAWQAASMAAFLSTQNEAGLFTVAAAFGLGFSGIIPAYILAVRELFPASEASWRIPTLLLFSGGGMAAGGWIAGLLYDHLGYYAPAFAVGHRRQHSQSACGRCAGRAATPPRGLCLNGQIEQPCLHVRWAFYASMSSTEDHRPARADPIGNSGHDDAAGAGAGAEPRQRTSERWNGALVPEVSVFATGVCNVASTSGIR